jgi:hypothetical protein
MRAGRSDGYHIVWLNGKQVLSKTGLMLSGSTNTEHFIEKVIFHDFHGGSGPTFAPRQTQFIWCDPRAVLCGARFHAKQVCGGLR